MKYYIHNLAFAEKSRTIETESDMELISDSKTVFVNLKNDEIIGIDLLKNSLIRKAREVKHDSCLTILD